MSRLSSLEVGCETAELALVVHAVPAQSCSQLGQRYPSRASSGRLALTDRLCDIVDPGDCLLLVDLRDGVGFVSGTINLVGSLRFIIAVRRDRLHACIAL